MQIRHVSESTVELVAHHGGDARTARKAWVSTDKAEGKTEEDVKRIVKYLYRHQHTPPFYASGVAFRVKAPYRTIVQIARHMTAVPNLEPCDVGDVHSSVVQSSARYGAVAPELYVHESLMCIEDFAIDVRVQELLLCATRSLELWTEINAGLSGKQNDIRDEINNYLPQGAMSTIDVDFNLWSFRTFLLRRADSHAQETIREISGMMWDKAKELSGYEAYFEVLDEELRKVGICL